MLNRIQLGDECAEYFHAIATISYRNNVITTSKDEAGNILFDHESSNYLALFQK